MRNLFLTLLVLLFFTTQSNAESRIKDIVNFEGVRDNMLIGYGLVVGLNGTGDNLKNAVFTEKGLSEFLEKLGINTRGANLKTKNVAAVTVTAILPPFSHPGSKIPVNVSTIGDSKSLKGGMLLATPLLGADGEVYAVAQGQISISTKPPKNKADTKGTTTSPTAGFIPSGAIIERQVDFDMKDLKEVKLALKNPDISTSRSIETAINSAMREDVAKALDPGTIVVKSPPRYDGNTLSFLADIENIIVYPDTVAKIIVDESSGTVVIGENVRISKVAVAQGNLIVQVSDDQEYLYNIGMLGRDKPQPSQPGEKIGVINQSTRLHDLIEGLNSIGVRPHDLVSILKTIQYSGALQAEIEVR